MAAALIRKISALGLILAPPWPPLALSCPLLASSRALFPVPSPTGAPKKQGRRPGRRVFWGYSKTSYSEQSIAETLAKTTFRNIALTGAVRKGELLRGKVSQGRPHPLSMALRCEGQTLQKKI